MNRLEKIIEELESEIERGQKWSHGNGQTWVSQVNTPRIAFLKWLLEESDESIIYEFHTGDVKPSVWGMGDVTYSMDIQLNKLKAYSKPVVFVVKYPVE